MSPGHRYGAIWSPLRCRPTPPARLLVQMRSLGWCAWPGHITLVHGCPPATTTAAPQIEPPPPPTPHCSREAAGCERKELGTEGCPTHPQLRTGARSTVGAPWWLPGRSLKVNALSWRTLVFQSLVHSQLAPSRGSSEGTSAPRPSSAGERVTSGSSPKPLGKNPQCWRPGVVMETRRSGRPPPGNCPASAVLRPAPACTGSHLQLPQAFFPRCFVN